LPEQSGVQTQVVPSPAVQAEPQPSSAPTHLSVQSGVQQEWEPSLPKQMKPQPSLSPVHLSWQSGTQVQLSAPLATVQTAPQPS
jgi:hypothetical protein